jgi:GT2 family glycosyltransferase
MTCIAPVRLLEIELSEPLPELTAFDEVTNQRYTRSLCLVRLHTYPLGLIELFFTKERLLPEDYVKSIWEVFASSVNRHLLEDKQAPLTTLDVAGVSATGIPLCIEERERFLEHAPFVSVIVPTSNSSAHVQHCLNALLRLHYPLYEIIIVDSAPRDKTTAKLVKGSYSNKSIAVRYVSEHRPGIAHARNRGMAAARGSVLAYVDDTVLADAYLLAEQVRAFNVAENVACVTGQIVPMALKMPQPLCSEEHSAYSQDFVRQIFDLKRLRAIDRPFYSSVAAHFTMGANMAFRAEYLRSTGGFDTLLGRGSDIEASFRVVSRGYRLVYEPAALSRYMYDSDRKTRKNCFCSCHADRKSLFIRAVS